MDVAAEGAAGSSAFGLATAFEQPEVAAADAPFDPASLPSIDAIDVETDIRGFLQSGVPAKLTRDALRRAWTNDPAIRDFIGIAENQWDFNGSDTISGFGPLPEGCDLSALLSQVLGGSRRFAETVLDTSTSDERLRSAVTDRESAEPALVMPRTSAKEYASLSVARAIEQSESSPLAEATDPPPEQRRHGSALPRLG
jgi:hypothetical protein